MRSTASTARSFGRRAAIGFGLALLGAAAAAAAALSSRTNRYRFKTFLRESVLHEPQLDGSPVGALNEGEMATLVALAEVALPSESGIDTAGFARHHFHRRAASEAGFLSEYRSTVVLLDGEAQQRGADGFAAASPEARQAVLESLLWSHPNTNVVAGYLEQAFSSPQALAMRRFVLSDLLAAFFASPDGWSLLGYQHFPGVPAVDPLDYVRPVGRERG